MNGFLRVSLRRLAWLIAAVGSLGLAAPFTVQAQSFPTKPVHLIVPNAPGGSIDILARLLSQKLQELWGQPVIVDYKPGVGTVLGTDLVAKSAPDGYTLGLQPVGATPEQFDAYIRTEIEKWAKVVKFSGAKAD